MNIREATEADLPQIITLLKLSLGESMMPKSVDYWRWKHIDNPFGRSPVLLAEDNGELIGVRAFLRWKWQRKGQTISTIRAVDTATHPDYQGKGIFRKLTMQLLDKCTEMGAAMVYNTPNDQSKPGYLKMGWIEAGKLPVELAIKRPLNILRAKLLSAAETRFVELRSADFSLSEAISQFSNSFSESDVWRTAYSREYLVWRYAEIPVIPYYSGIEEDALVIFRIKHSTLGTELRICDTFGPTERLNNILKNIYRNCNFDYMSIDGFSPVSLPGLVRVNLAIGPDVTLRYLNGTDLSEFKGFTLWKPKFGDLEVF